MDLHTPDRTRLALVGAGKVGTAIAYLLNSAGHQVAAVASRSESSARRASSLLDAPVVTGLEELPVVDVVLLGLTEEAIPEVAQRLAVNVTPGTIVIHLAGATGISALAALEGTGARRAALHPVQAMPSVERAIALLPGSSWGVTCDEDVRDWAHGLIREDLHGDPVDVVEEHRPLWHAASVGTSNTLAALLSLGERILTSVGVSDASRVLGSLASGTLANASHGGGGGATLTGPIVRGERATIQRHIEALEETAPELVSPYKLAARLVLDSALSSQRVDARAGEEMSALLGDES